MFLAWKNKKQMLSQNTLNQRKLRKWALLLPHLVERTISANGKSFIQIGGPGQEDGEKIMIFLAPAQIVEHKFNQEGKLFLMKPPKLNKKIVITSE